MTFDLSIFPQIGAFLFGIGKSIYESLIFDFGDFQLNGWIFLLGIAIVCIIIYLVRRLAE